MKQKLLLILMMLFTLGFTANAQTTVKIGAGTTSNGNATYPAPFGNYYWGAKNQQLYLASELTAAGILPGAIINAVGFDVTALAAAAGTPLTAFELKIGTTTVGALTATFQTGVPSNGAAANYTPTLGVNTFTLTTPIVWNGTDNIIVETCFNNAAWTNNDQVEWTTGSAVQVSTVYRADNATNCGQATSNYTQNTTTRSNLVVTYIPPAGCIQPTGVAAANITTTTADVSYTDNNTTPALNFDVFYQLAGAPAPTNTTVPSIAATTANPVPLTMLMPNTNYDVYVRAHCSATDTSAWGGPATFLTLPLCATPTALTAANFVLSGGSFTADLGWTDNNATAPPAWEIELLPVGSTFTGTPNLTGITANPYTTPAALTPNTDYIWQVRAACGGTASNSPWSVQGAFTTPCAPVTVATFNTQGTFETGAIPSCWTQNAASTNHWRFTGTPGNPTITALNHTVGAASTSINGTNAWCDGSSALANESFELTSVGIQNADIVAMTNPLLTYYVTEDNGNATPALLNENNQFVCQLSYDNGTTFVDVTNDRAEGAKDQWIRYSVEIDKTALGTNDLIVRFTMNTLNLTASTIPYSFWNDHVIDDVNITDATCASLFTGIAAADAAADCQCEDAMGWTHYGTQTGELMLSVSKVTPADPNYSPSNVSIGGTTAGNTDLSSTAPYVTSLWWIVMNRHWDVDITDAARQPSANVPVRFYYSTADYNSVVAGVGAATPAPTAPLAAHTDMFFYKIANADPDPVTGHSTVPTADYTQLTNGAASATSWAYSAFGTDHQAEFEVASFSGGGGGFGHQNGALPAEIINFNVVKDGTASQVSWNTASEQNNSHFNVQRSTNGTDFITLGEVASLAPNGNSAVELAYSFTDETPQMGHNYYRLQQVDIDQQYSFTNVIDIIWGTNGDVVTIYPNPVKDVLNVDANVTKASQIELKVVDMSGRVVKSSLTKTQQGVNNIQLNVKDLASGVYNLQVIENNKLIYTDKVRKND